MWNLMDGIGHLANGFHQSTLFHSTLQNFQASQNYTMSLIHNDVKNKMDAMVGGLA